MLSTSSVLSPVDSSGVESDDAVELCVESSVESGVESSVESGVGSMEELLSEESLDDWEEELSAVDESLSSCVASDELSLLELSLDGESELFELLESLDKDELDGELDEEELDESDPERSGRNVHALSMVLAQKIASKDKRFFFIGKTPNVSKWNYIYFITSNKKNQ